MSAEINYSMGPKNGLKTKILFIITQSEFGGAQRFLFNFLSNIDREKYDPVVAVGRDGDQEFSNSLKSKNVPVIKLNRLTRNENLINDLLAIGEIKEKIREEKPHLLFLGSSKAGFIGSLASRSFKNLKVIYRIGGWTFRDPWPAWKKWLWRQLEKLSASWKDYIIVNSAEDLEAAKTLGIKPRKDVVLIHNGIDPYKFSFLSRDEARQKLNIDNKKIIVGTIANFYPAKGLPTLIESASFLKHIENIQFVIIGDGPDREKIEELIRKHDLGEKIILAGRIPNASNLVAALDIFVLPSLKEGGPWALIEAMAGKIPVIATRVGAVGEIIEDGKNGILIEPGQSKQMVEAILALLNNERLRSELAISGHQTVLLKFSQDKMMRSFEKVFEEVLK